MAVFRSGNGGGISVGANNLITAKWTLDTGVRSTENTHSGTGGFTNYEKVVVDPKWSIDAPLNESQLPAGVIGLAAGNKADIRFHIGGGSILTYLLSDTLVETLEYSNDNAQDIVRIRLSGKGGSL